jgi:hypothetical protein
VGCSSLCLDENRKKDENFFEIHAKMEQAVTRFAQPHIHVYMFCPYVISTSLPVT